MLNGKMSVVKTKAEVIEFIDDLMEGEISAEKILSEIPTGYVVYAVGYWTSSLRGMLTFCLSHRYPKNPESMLLGNHAYSYCYYPDIPFYSEFGNIHCEKHGDIIVRVE